MAQRSISTSDRIHLVYTGDPAFAEKPTPMREWTVRRATPDDRVRGATVYVVRPLNGPERDEVSIRSRRIVRDEQGAIIQSVWDLEVIEALHVGLLSVEGDPRPLPEIIATMPHRCRISLGSAIILASDLPIDPFALPASV